MATILRMRHIVVLSCLSLLLAGCQVDITPRDFRRDVTVVVPHAASWVVDAAIDYEQAGGNTRINLVYAESGLIYDNIDADLWIPESNMWTELAGLQCDPLGSSPLVIAMPNEVANTVVGGRDFGWLDLTSLAADPTQWQYYSGADQAIRIGHTNPGVSGSGADTLLAVGDAAGGLETATARASIGFLESAVTWFAPDDARLLQQELDVYITYENNVPSGLTAITPREGTRHATYSTCVINDIGQSFADYLQSASLPLTAARSDSSASDLQAIQALWRGERTPLDVTLVIDTSGSMRGEKIESVKVAASAFVEDLSDDDLITLVDFDDGATVLISDSAPNQNVIETILRLDDDGGTDIEFGLGVGLREAQNDEGRRRVIVLLSDGQSAMPSDIRDAYSARYNLDGITVFTIAYGNDADLTTLTGIANAFGGQTFDGDVAEIGRIYDQLAITFGAVGVGR